MLEGDTRVKESVENLHLDTDTKYKAVDYIETYTGRPFWPLKPRPEDVSIIDIAHHLSNQCRYSGAPSFFYSTAQHCCLLADYTQDVLGRGPIECLQILTHDAPEAYLVDIPRPVKQFMPDYRKWDKAINNAIRTWLGLGDVPIPEWQDELDSRIIVDERAQIMSDSGNDWGHDLEPLGIEIAPWSNVQAEQQFLLRYANYTKKIFGKHQYLRASWRIPTHSTYSFRSAATDVARFGEQDPRLVTDLKEVDIRGGVGRVAVRSPNGMMVRDTRAGKFPTPAWKWLHGTFALATPGVEDTNVELNREPMQ